MNIPMTGKPEFLKTPNQELAHKLAKLADEAIALGETTWGEGLKQQAMMYSSGQLQKMMMSMFETMESLVGENLTDEGENDAEEDINDLFPSSIGDD